jgi:hypothetical protein
MAVASRSIRNLEAAVEGFHREHGSSPEHEGASKLLQRAMAELHGAGPPPSPGENAAHLAAMGSETGHAGGDGQVRSNESGSAGHGEPVVDIHGSSERSDHMTKTEPVPSRGNVISAMPGGMAGGTSEVRRIAAQREMSRRDSRFSPLTRAGESNKESNPKGEGYPAGGRIGNATSSVKKLGAVGGDGDSDDMERNPVRLQQQRNPFARASEQARARFRGGRG